MPLYRYNSALLRRTAALAVSEACCCNPCCPSSLGCQVRVTVTYSNGAVRTNGDAMLDENGDPVAGTVIMPTIGACGELYFAHNILNDLNIGCNQGASKTQKVACAVCCADGTGCQCVLDAVLSEDYSFNPNDPGADCTQPITIVYVTDISFSLEGCIPCDSTALLQCECSCTAWDAFSPSPPQICINTPTGPQCHDIDVSVEWCGMTANVFNPFIVEPIDWPCDEYNSIGQKTLTISVYCEVKCNCVVVTVYISLMTGSGATPREYVAVRSACGSGMNTSSLYLSPATILAPGICGDGWYADAGCDSDPVVTINFAP